MLENRNLKGRRIAVLAADGFEQIELTVPVAALRAAGAKTDIISLRSGRIRGVNLHEPGRKIKVDRTIEETDTADYDGLFLPGGLINPDLLRQSKAAREFVRAFDMAHKPIAVICHAPWLLASAGLVAGRSLTSWPGVRDDLVNAGATWLDQEVIRDGNWVSSRGPQDLLPFVRAITQLFGESVPINVAKTAPQSTESSPQHDTPPQVVLSAMKWLPKPSVRTAVGVGLLVAGAVVASRYQKQAA